ncbi:MAG: ATP synthase subunit I [Candidatus Methylopumilus sp.]|nr:ATP synthase subunit I [Candidatus Methylopumilus sp.]
MKLDSAVQAIKLTDADRLKIDVRARRELLFTVVAQSLVGVFVALIFFAFGGVSAALSSLAGSAAYLVPNAVFALRLWVATYRPGGASPEVFLIGEILKVGAAVGLLWLIAHLGGEQVNWIAVLVSLVATLKGYIVLMMFKGSWAK